MKKAYYTFADEAGNIVSVFADGEAEDGSALFRVEGLLSADQLVALGAKLRCMETGLDDCSPRWLFGSAALRHEFISVEDGLPEGGAL